MSKKHRTLIEIVDPVGVDGYFIKPREIHINGVPVAVEKYGLDIEYAEEDVIRVHLTLLPDQVVFRRGPATEGDQQ